MQTASLKGPYGLRTAAVCGVQHTTSGKCNGEAQLHPTNLSRTNNCYGVQPGRQAAQPMCVLLPLLAVNTHQSTLSFLCLCKPKPQASSLFLPLLHSCSMQCTNTATQTPYAGALPTESSQQGGLLANQP